MSETTKSASPLPLSALMSAPRSVLRVVTMPSNGATMRLKSASTTNRSTLAWADFVKASLSGEIAGLLVARLARYRIRSHQRLPALDRDLASCRLPAHWRESHCGLQELLVEVRRLDLGQKLAGLDRRADIDLQRLQETADAGIERRPRVGLEPAGQIEEGLVGAGPRGHDADGRERPGFQSSRAGEHRWQPGWRCRC